ncbi:DRTGG domain-containing protein [Natranaerobius trueperi]|nr:DRTGG domain-containing protein [Natranaerobius trueperi]
MTKHQELIKYITDLPVGTKISVRKTAHELSVSDGTAYRAIKDAENKGLVTTIPKTGTIRIKNNKKEYSQTVTFAELIKVVNGTVLGGNEGLYKPLDKFIIGAMELKEMSEYINEGSLLIVGNREKAHELALKKGAAVLISGGFDTNMVNRELADKCALPIITSPYDTYRIATLINKALTNKNMENEILHVEDIMSDYVYYLKETDTYDDWKSLLDQTKHSRFPVVDLNNIVKGVVTSKDITGKKQGTPVYKMMTKNPITVSPETLIASVAYIMIWEGIEMIPVVAGGGCLKGVVSRQDVMEAMQFGNGQDENSGVAFKKLIEKNFSKVRTDIGVELTGYVTPAMTNQMGGMEPAILTTLLMQASFSALGHDRDYNVVLENFSFNYLAPIQLQQKITVVARTLENSRKYGKVDLEIRYKDQILVKGFVSSQILKK